MFQSGWMPQFIKYAGQANEVYTQGREGGACLSEV